MRRGTRSMITRCIRIVQMLVNGRKVQAHTIAEELEVSHRTVMRDLDYLTTECDLPIAYDRPQGTYRFTQPLYKSPLEFLK